MLPFYVWGFYFLSPLSTIYIGVFACTQCIHLVRCFWCTFGVHFSIRPSIWAFSDAIYFASLSFISFSICICLAFSSASLLASFSLNCLSHSVALFLSYLGLSSFTILAISISSSSGTFCLYVLTFVLDFIYSV